MLLNGVLSSLLGGRRKSSRRLCVIWVGRLGRSAVRSCPTRRVLTAAGVAWGIYETLQQGPAGTSAPGTPAVRIPAARRPRNDSTAASVARCRERRGAGQRSGTPDGAPRDIRSQCRWVRQRAGTKRDSGTCPQCRSRKIVEHELAQPRSLAEIVAGVSDETQRATLYVLAFSIVRGDEQPSGAERIYLAKLAHLLGLDPKTVQQLEQNAARRIDAEPEQ